MTAIYVSILKGKQGELKALTNTRKQEKAKLLPLIEIPPVPLKYVDGSEDPIQAKSIEAHITDTSEKLCQSLLGFEQVLVDGFYVEEDDALPNGLEPIAELFNKLRAAKIPFIPVVGLDRVEEYSAAIADAVEEDGNGCCLRLTNVDLDVPPNQLIKLIDSLLAELKIMPSKVDLLVDYGPEVPVKSALLYQLNALPYLMDWRNLVVASSSFPTDMSNVAPDSLVEFERKEWSAWSYLRANSESVKRLPIYGDYGINHPVLSDIDPRLMRLSPNIRYTSTLNYVVAKGRAYPRKNDKTKKANTKAADQLPKLAKLITSHKSWKTGEFSWGDAFIEACSNKACVGNATDWRAVGTSHHIAFVVHQLSSLPSI